MRLSDRLRRFFGIGKRDIPLTTLQGAASTYNASSISRLTNDWVTQPLSADREIRYDLTRLRARARDLVRNSGYAARFLALLTDNVVGPKGIVLDVDVTGADGRASDMTSEAVEEAWKAWGRAGVCTVDGTLSWLDFQRLYTRSLAQDGECVVRLFRGFDNGFGLALQLIDPDLLDVNMNRPAGRDGNEVRMGVERDTFGRPVAYHFWRHHPNDTEFGRRDVSHVRVPADEILHDFMPTRIGQTRGVTWFAPVMLNAQMLRGYAEAEVTAARVAASKMGFLVPAADAAGVQALPGEAPFDQALTMEASPGTFDQLPPGYDVKTWNPEHPGSEFTAFTKAMLREIAAGLGVSYGPLANDPGDANYSSMRTFTLLERDSYRALQVWLIEHLHSRVYREFVRMARLAGKLPPAARAAEADEAVEWQPRGWGWVDPRADIEAIQMAIALGIDSRKATLAEEGREIEDVFADLAAEKALADELGISVEGKTPAPAPKAPTAGSEDPTAPAPMPEGDMTPPGRFAALGQSNGNGRHA